jgi:hypothetical protein
VQSPAVRGQKTLTGRKSDPGSGAVTRCGDLRHPRACGYLLTKNGKHGALAHKSASSSPPAGDPLHECPAKPEHQDASWYWLFSYHQIFSFMLSIIKLILDRLFINSKFQFLKLTESYFLI